MPIASGSMSARYYPSHYDESDNHSPPSPCAAGEHRRSKHSGGQQAGDQSWNKSWGKLLGESKLSPTGATQCPSHLLYPPQCRQQHHQHYCPHRREEETRGYPHQPNSGDEGNNRCNHSIGEHPKNASGPKKVEAQWKCAAGGYRCHRQHLAHNKGKTQLCELLGEARCRPDECCGGRYRKEKSGGHRKKR